MSMQCALGLLPTIEVKTCRYVGEFMLNDLFPAGVICISLNAWHPLCITHDKGVWHYLRHDIPFTHDQIKNTSERDMESLRFVIEHKYVAAMCQLVAKGSGAVLCVRVYFVPWDMKVSRDPRYRDSSRATMELAILAAKLDTAGSAWVGEGTDGTVLAPNVPIMVSNKLHLLSTKWLTWASGLGSV